MSQTTETVITTALPKTADTRRRFDLSWLAALFSPSGGSWPLWFVQFYFRLFLTRPFYQQLKIFAMGNVPVDETIDELLVQARDSKQKIYAQALEIFSDRLNKRADLLSVALRGWIPVPHLLILSAADGSNRKLAEALGKIMVMQRKLSELKISLFILMFEPVLIIFGTYGLTVWMATSFVNHIMAFLHNDSAHFYGLAAQLVYLGKLGRGFGAWVPPLVMLAVGWLVLGTMGRWTGRLRRYFDKIPPWSIYRALQGASWMQAFALLSAAGVPYEKIMLDTAGYAKPWLRERLLAIHTLMARRGRGVGQAIWESGYGFPSPQIAANLKAFSARNGLGEALANIADEWFDNIVGFIRGVSALMAIFIMMVSAGGIIWTMLASNDMINQATAIMRTKYGA